MMRGRKHVQEDNVDSWLMSYADMITLLLCFFIIFVSVSEPKKERISAITNGMAGKFGTVDLSTPFQGVFQALQATIEKHAPFKDVAVEKSDNGVSIELASEVFFQKDSAEFMADKGEVLAEMVAAIKSADFLDYRITIEGHTNDVPVTSSIYPSNWELSSARAAHIVRYFIAQGVKPEKLKAVGFADTEPKVPNLDANGGAIIENREKNQRVVVRLERVH